MGCRVCEIIIRRCVGLHLEPSLKSVRETNVSAVTCPDCVCRLCFFLYCLVTVVPSYFCWLGGGEIYVFRQYESWFHSIYRDRRFCTVNVNFKCFVFSLYDFEWAVVGML